MIALAWLKCVRKEKSGRVESSEVSEFEHFLESDGVHTILVDTTLLTDITTPLRVFL